MLADGIPRHKLAVLSAPAGYGKTTLLTQWAQESRFPVAWVSIDEGDDDLLRFLRYLLAGWEAIAPGIKDSPVGLLLHAREPDTDAVLAAFVNGAAGRSDHTVFVLDDYHLIEEPAVHTALTFLLDHLPPTLHFVLAGRGEPSLPLARLLQEARTRQVMPDYVGKLLATFGDDRTSPASASASGVRALPEPLSEREQEVLRLIAAGLTNREIADRLIISPETVKKHTASIYDKLGVGNRTEAAARGRQLDLLD